MSKIKPGYCQALTCFISFPGWRNFLVDNLRTINYLSNESYRTPVSIVAFEMSTQHNTLVALTEITVKALKSVCLVFADIRKLLADVPWRHLNENISVQSHTAISSSHYNLSLENYVYKTLFPLTRSNRTAIRALGKDMDGSTSLLISVHNRRHYIVTVNWPGH